MNKFPYMPLPSKQLRHKTSGSVSDDVYLSIGKGWVDEFIKLGLFNSGDKVLDVGCGDGKVTRHMVDKLNPDVGGELHGFDIHHAYVQWLSDNISREYPNFIFKHIDAHNRYYNPDGVIEPDKVIFPYDDNYFDFSYSTSLFTHMTKKSVEHYLREIFRVSKVGCVHFATFFCFEKDVSEIPNDDDPRRKLSRYDDVSYVADLHKPEVFIAYVNSYLEELVTNIGFYIQHKPVSNFQAVWIFKKQ